MELTGQELEQLKQALLKAYDISSLKQMLRFKLEKDLDAITTANGFNNIVFDLISIASKEGWLIQLIGVAKDYNPSNEFLNTIVTTLVNKPKSTLNQPNNESLLSTPSKRDSIIDQYYLDKQIIPEITFNTPKIIDISVDELKALIPRIEILLLSVNDWERKALLSEMTPIDGKDGILQGALDKLTYRIGMFGNYCAAYTESTMGSDSRHGATLIAKIAVDELKPKAVLLLGIAFGIDSDKQKLGDVLIAESIQPYEYQKVHNDFSITYRGQATPCGNILSERFRMRRSDWIPKHADKSFEDVKVHQGLVLSGNKLVNNKDFRDALVKAFPTSIGGEMEGAGAYSAISSPTEVILIKSICDWADGDKNDLAQPFAAFTAISLAKHVLSKPDVLHPLISAIKQNLEISPKNNPSLPFPKPTLLEGALSIECMFYIDRPANSLSKTIETECYEAIRNPYPLIVIKGSKETGKTSLLLRVLNESKNQTKDIKTVYLSFQIFQNNTFKDLRSLLRQICFIVANSLGLDNKLDNIWDDSLLDATTNCTQYFETHILKNYFYLTLALDKIDRIFDFPIAKDFLTLLRFWHERSKLNAKWKGLILILTHSTECYVSMDPTLSPFNVGTCVKLPPFLPEQVEKLAILYQLNLQKKQIETLNTFLGGHPYLIQIALYNLHQGINFEQFILESHTGIYQHQLTRLLKMLQQHTNLILGLKKVMVSTQPVKLEKEISAKLEGLGITQCNNNYDIVSSELYRKYFIGKLE